jgi:hypothetical protein
MLHERTLATLDKLRGVEWFSAVGKEVKGSFVNVHSWAEAVEWCGSDDWRDLQLEAANRYCEQLAKRSLERFRRWNVVALEVREVVIPFVENKTGAVIHANSLPKTFENSVRWDMIHLCMEAEFADVYPPGFFASQAYWYAEGHFPCGWEGKFPDGRLVLY